MTFLLFFVTQNVHHTRRKLVYARQNALQPQVGQVWRNVRKEKYLKKIEHLIMPGQIHLHLLLPEVLPYEGGLPVCLTCGEKEAFNTACFFLLLLFF